VTTAAVPAGIVVVDKPAGLTSHDVVARVRRLLGTRRVGHAGTLDPMATGVLVLGVERGTRVLGHLALADKAYDAPIRLGAATTTDDAEGEPLGRADASGLPDASIAAATTALTGDLLQVPAAVSAIKVDGRRAYARVRAGEQVARAARPVTVSELRIDAIRRDGPWVDVDVHVECSKGTYVRALARDLGAALGVGGHLTALRRTRVGGFTLEAAQPLEEGLQVTPLATALAAEFPSRTVDADAARAVLHGGRLALAGETGPTAVLGPEGTLLAIMAPKDGRLAALAVLADPIG
jgi:tRNA pseudouridine55 synthase